MNRISADNQITEIQDFPAPKPISLFSLDLSQRRAEFEAQNGKGIEHEFQELGKKLEPIYGKRIWAVFHEPKGTEENVKKAHAACVRYGKVGNYAYFRGVLKNL